MDPRVVLPAPALKMLVEIFDKRGEQTDFTVSRAFAP